MSNTPPMSKRRGQYVSRACNECRRRRCKCDGGQPSCGACVFYV
ncbi:fungal zn, 2-cys(6) binuclear cluster domain protein, partial [Rhizoctonia solani 123E]